MLYFVVPFRFLPQKKTLTISPYLSRKLSRLSFLGMLTVVYVHSFNFDDRYLWAGRPFFEEMNAFNFIQILVTNGLFRFGVPLFFFRAGMLMAATEEKYTPLTRLKKRGQTLLIPYLAWSLFGILITYYFESRPDLAPFAESSWLRPFGNLPVHKWDLSQWFESVLIQPVSFQLWFLRSLFMYSLLYPILVKGLSWKPQWILGTFCFLWLSSFGGIALVEGEGLFFFTLGIFFAKGGVNEVRILEFFLRYRLYWIALTVVLLKTFVSFQFDDQFLPVYLLHKIAQPLLVLSVWFGYDYVFGQIQHTPLEKLSRYNFFVYGAHVPLVYYLTDLLFSIYGKDDSIRFAVFCSLPLVVAASAIIIGFVLEKAVYPVFWVLTGGRK